MLRPTKCTRAARFGYRAERRFETAAALEQLLALLFGFIFFAPAAAANACQAEIATACPDRPGSEMARCLKDQSEHEVPTSISSECMDFIALNVACADDIAKFCDEAFFTDDTMLCLAEWTPRHNLGAKCASVLKWAAPQTNVEGPTDELGMSEKDYAEKKQWQDERRASRSAAVEKMREDKQREREMEALKKEDPQAYAQMIKEKEEAKRSYDELLRRKRLMAAAEARKLREETGETDEDTAKNEKAGKKRRPAQSTKPTGWLPYALGGLALAFVVFNILNFFQRNKGDKLE